MTLNPLGSVLPRLKILEEKMHWVTCPFCSEEVNALVECSYWENGEEKKSNLCCDCAETPDGIQYMSLVYPIPGVLVSVNLLPAFKSIPEKYRTKSHLEAVVGYCGWTFRVQSKQTKLMVLEERKTEDQAKFYANTYQVWFALKRTFEKGIDAPSVDENTVGKTKRFKASGAWKHSLPYKD